MSRKFKFRVWSIPQKRYFDPYAEEDPQFGLTDHEENWGVTVYTFDRESHDFTNLHSLGDSIIIEQFSGLLDCEGTEIFEGDLCSPNKDSGNPLVKVIYENGSFWFNGDLLYNSEGTICVRGNVCEGIL